VARPGALALHRWRRLDWRFLVPARAFGTVACAGEVDDELRTALPLLTDDVRAPATAADWLALAETCDVVVLVRPSAAELHRALGALRPGGWLYAEVRRRALGGRPRTVPGWRAELERAGLQDVTAYWQVPPPGGPAAVSLASRTALEHVADRTGEGRAAGVRALLARGLLAAGLFPVTVAEGAVVGRRPVP
jgi:hypothetical protein